RPGVQADRHLERRHHLRAGIHRPRAAAAPPPDGSHGRGRGDPPARTARPCRHHVSPDPTPLQRVHTNIVAVSGCSLDERWPSLMSAAGSALTSGPLPSNPYTAAFVYLPPLMSMAAS